MRIRQFNACNIILKNKFTQTALIHKNQQPAHLEAWGRGIEKINKQCTIAGLPLPLIYYAHSGC